MATKEQYRLACQLVRAHSGAMAYTAMTDYDEYCEVTSYDEYDGDNYEEFAEVVRQEDWKASQVADLQKQFVEANKDKIPSSLYALAARHVNQVRHPEPQHHNFWDFHLPHIVSIRVWAVQRGRDEITYYLQYRQNVDDWGQVRFSSRSRASFHFRHVGAEELEQIRAEIVEFYHGRKAQ